MYTIHLCDHDYTFHWPYKERAERSLQIAEVYDIPITTVHIDNQECYTYFLEFPEEYHA